MSNRYIDWFIKKSDRARDLLELDLFPNSKEITESFSMMTAVHEKIGIEWSDDKCLCIVVGDGARPRTGCLFAFYTNWFAISIDPALSRLKPTLQEKLKGVIHFWYYPNKIENSIENPSVYFGFGLFDTVIFIHPHAHALLSYDLQFIKKYNIQNKKIWIVSMPCCVPDNINIEHYSYYDNQVQSAKNQINIYPVKNVSIRDLKLEEKTK